MLICADKLKGDGNEAAVFFFFFFFSISATIIAFLHFLHPILSFLFHFLFLLCK